MQTPLWVPLIVAAIGVIGTLAGGVAGVLITQRRADLRDEKTWQRERERERERWDRDDSRRTFEHRREAYMEFYAAIQAMMLRIHDHVYGISQEKKLEADFQMGTLSKLRTLSFYAPLATRLAAEDAFHKAHRWGYTTAYGDSRGEDGRPPGASANDALDALLPLLRADLHIVDDERLEGANAPRHL